MEKLTKRQKKFLSEVKALNKQGKLALSAYPKNATFTEIFKSEIILLSNQLDLMAWENDKEIGVMTQTFFFKVFNPNNPSKN